MGNISHIFHVVTLFSIVWPKLRNSSGFRYLSTVQCSNIVQCERNLTYNIETRATKEELNVVNQNIEEVRNIVNSKVDASYVEEYFINNVSNIVGEEIEKQNISQQVSDAVDKKLENFEGVTTETLDEALQSNEYFTTNVITPIESIIEKVNTIETQIKDLDADIDGGEEEEWEI